MFKTKFEKNKYWDGIFGISYNTTNHENNNKINIYLPFRYLLQFTIPPYIKGKKDEYNDLRNNGFYLDIGKEYIYFNYGVEYNESSKNHVYIFNYPWNVEYVNNSKKYLDSYGNVLENINEEEKWEYSWNGGSSELVKYYEIIDPWDGTKFNMKCFLTRDTYQRGRGLFKKVFNYIFKRYYIYRIETYFENEFGDRKDSWKGGTISSSIPLPKLMHIPEAVKYMCDKECIKYFREL